MFSYTCTIIESYHNKPNLCIFETELLGRFSTDLDEIAHTGPDWDLYDGPQVVALRDLGEYVCTLFPNTELYYDTVMCVRVREGAPRSRR